MFMDDTGPGPAPKAQPSAPRAPVAVSAQGRRILETVAQITLHRNDAVELLRKVLTAGVELPPALVGEITELVAAVDTFVAAMPR